MESRSPRKYSKPPIIEAVISVGVAEPLPLPLVHELADQFARYYPGLSKVEAVRFMLDPKGPEVQRMEDKTEFRRATDDQQQILLLHAEYMSVCQLAPYSGWETYRSRFVRDWQFWRDRIGQRRLSKIGLRFINRIDVPSANLPDRVDSAAFLTTGISVPPEFGAVNGYSIQGQFHSVQAKSVVVLNTAYQGSPVPEHMSFVFDIDIIRSSDVPQRTVDVLDVLEIMRQVKNRLFEASITDTTRALFQ